MGVRHKTWPLHGVQFHPESFLTLEGPKLLQQFPQCLAFESSGQKTRTLLAVRNAGGL